MTGSFAARHQLGHDGVGVGVPQRRVAHRDQTMPAIATSATAMITCVGGVAEPGHEPRREERRQRRATHAGAEDAGGEAARAASVPRVDEGDADREGRAGDAEEEAEDQQQGVGAGLPASGHEQHERRGQHEQHR